MISAVGDVPNVEWLASSRLPVSNGLVVDQHCRVTPEIVGAGDVTTTREPVRGGYRRTPHWTSAVLQGRTAARSLLEPSAPPLTPDHNCWTEQFGCAVKFAGELPPRGVPEVLAGDPREGSALLQWRDGNVPTAAAAVNHRMPIVKLKALARPSRT